MELAFTYLDEITRRFMLEEVELDIVNNTLHEIAGINERGRCIYPALLKKAVISHDSIWLARHLCQAHYFNCSESEIPSEAGIVSKTAIQLITLGEFNYFYMRGLCRRALSEHQESMLFYRVQDAVELLDSPLEQIYIKVRPDLMLKQLRTYVGKTIGDYSRQSLTLDDPSFVNRVHQY